MNTERVTETCTEPQEGPMSSSAPAAAAPSAVDTLLSRVEYRDVQDFTLRGRRYTLRLGAFASFSDGAAVFSVFTAAGKPARVKVRDADAVEVLSRA